MRYEILKYNCPELDDKFDEACHYDNITRGFESRTFPYYPNNKIRKGFVYSCKNCGAEFYGAVGYYDLDPKCYDRIKARKESAAWIKEMSPDSVAYNEHMKRFKSLEKAVKAIKQAVDLGAQVKRKAEAEYESATKVKNCPICGAPLCDEKGYALRETEGRNSRELKSEELLDLYFKFNARDREEIDQAQVESDVKTFLENWDLPVASTVPPSPKVIEIREDSNKLSNHILQLLHLENNAYSLKQRLLELYARRLNYDRAAVLEEHEPAYAVRVCELETEKLKNLHQNTLKALDDAKVYQPEISVEYPMEPVAPVLGTPGVFNKKKVLAENEALTAQYQTALEAYKKEVERCDEEKARLVAEKRDTVLREAQKSVDEAKMAVDVSESNLSEKIKKLELQPRPARAIKELLDKEITETEELLKKVFAARNEMYEMGVIFGKYHDAVALASFYEYLMSGRCTTLEGPDGAYNIYEGEIRANRVIAQLDTVVASLEDIKQTQYLIYQELRAINGSMDRLNRTMDKAVDSIRSIESNTAKTNEYIEHVAQNSDVIAYNTAVTAYYSKVNAQLTDALGYMVAFK